MLVALPLLACDLLSSKDDDGDDEGAAGALIPEPQDEGDDGDATLQVKPLTRSERRLRFIGKGSERLGWKLSSLAEMVSLAGPVEVPEWGADGDGELRDTRDGDLATAWTCHQGRDKTCAFGIHFPRPATVVGVRVNASPLNADDPGAFDRVKVLRVHTDEGWAEDRFEADWEDLYLKLGEPIKTANLTIEIVESHHKGESDLRIAEFDVFGTEGEPRAPMQIEPKATYVKLDDPMWKKSGQDRTLQRSRLMYLGPDGRPQLLAQGSAAYAKGDRFVLIEELEQTRCKSHFGSYTLLDLKTHVRVPVGDLGGMPADVWAHKDGLAFVAGYVDEEFTSVHAIAFEGDKYQRKRSSRTSRETYHELFASWSVEEAPLIRGDGRTVDDPPAKCGAATAEQFERLQAARNAPPEDGQKKKSRGKSKTLGGPPDRWLACDLGQGVTAFSSTGEDCGSRWALVVVDKDGKLVAKQGDAAKGARVRVRRVTDFELFVEVGGEGDDVQVFDVRADAIESLGEHTTLAVWPPSSCRKGCADPYANPRAP